MKPRACYAATVIDSSAFHSMSLEAQLLYIYLGFECDVVGIVRSPGRVARGYGFPQDSVEELYGNGFLLRISEDEAVIRDNWINNNSHRSQFVAIAQKNSYIASGELSFEGEPFKSAYVLKQA